MIITIIIGIAWLLSCLLCIFQIITSMMDLKDFFIALFLGTLAASLLTGITLFWGYAKLSHSFTKEEIIEVIEAVPSVGIELAYDYNHSEHAFNNYFFRFTLREEDLIDIDFYLEEMKKWKQE